MVDTVILRIHNLVKYKHVIKSLDLYNNNGYETSIGKVSPEEFIGLLAANKNRKKEAIEMLKQKRTGEYIVKTKVGKQQNSSNHYGFIYFVNFFKDYIELNFSMPKYRFGSNIPMFIEHENDRDFNLYNATQLKYNLDKSFTLFSNFIRNFFKREFLFAIIDLKDVEVNRIDVCFNQVFNSKEEALLCLEYQKKLKKKNARNEEGVMQNYATSLMYVTNRYSAKIYHKGSEYKKNDLKEHLKYNSEKSKQFPKNSNLFNHKNDHNKIDVKYLKYNNEKNKQYFKTELFQAFADRILRYELTIRNTQLNYLHKRKIFRRSCHIWKAMYRDYLFVEGYNEFNTRIAKKIGKLKTVEEKLKYMLKHPYKKPIDQKMKTAHKIVTKIISRRRYFMLETDLTSKLFNSTSIPAENDFALFSSELYNMCLKKLFDFIDEYQVKELPCEEIIKRKIEDYNKVNSSQLPKSEMLHFYRHLIKHGSFKEAIKHSDFSRATLYRYIERFKAIEITDKCIKPIDKFYGIPQAPIDFKRYQHNILDKFPILRGLNIASLYYAFG